MEKTKVSVISEVYSGNQNNPKDKNLMDNRIKELENRIKAVSDKLKILEDKVTFIKKELDVAYTTIYSIRDNNGLSS